MKGAILKFPLPKRSIILGGHKTSVSMEKEFWTAFREIAKERGLTIANLVTSLGADRQNRNLSSTIRVFVLEHYRDRGSPHRKTHSWASRKGDA
jgi:predicted DNA-binding ribbon-helix-helix protein